MYINVFHLLRVMRLLNFFATIGFCRLFLSIFARIQRALLPRQYMFYLIRDTATIRRITFWLLRTSLRGRVNKIEYGHATVRKILCICRDYFDQPLKAILQ